MVGIGVGGYQTWIKCNHEIVMPGVTLKESDPDNPWIKSVSGVPSGWFDPQEVGSATIVAADNGFGVHDMAIYDGEVTNHAGFGCSGVSGSRCSGERSWTIAPPYRSGERTLEVFAEDPLGHTGKWTTTSKADNQAPAVELSGQLAEATEEVGNKGAENEADENKLSFSAYNLQIKATDGLETPATERQSGIKNIKVYLDGVQQTVPWSAQPCPTYSCKKEGTYQLKLLGLTTGEHKLKVVAEDQVGHLGEREIEFEYIPATGIDDDYVLQHFPLPDGEGNEAEEENPVRPELAVNVMNGNLVFRQQDVEVTGPGADLEVERFYNSQLPKAQNTEWGAGWTLAQTPELEIEQPKSGPPTEATMLEESGAVEVSVNLPTTTGEEVFDKEIQAVVTKEAHGYEVADESGDTVGAVAFDEAGEATEFRSPGAATVEVESQAGVLSELAVNDPGTAGGQAARSYTEPAEPHIYASDFGGETSGPGNLSAPIDTATDAEGNVWVADAGHNRVQEFNSKGEFLFQFGATGTGNGQFTQMHALAFDAEGHLWVAAAGRVQEFNAEGEYIRQFGSWGEGNGEFFALAGIAVDPAGHVWALDSGEGFVEPRLQEFSSEGAFLAEFGFAIGKEPGRLQNPQALAIDGSGNFWVADTGNNRIEEFSSKGAFLRASGSGGTENGQFKAPKGIEVDAGGDVWVADTGNNRIQELSTSGVYLAQFGRSGANNGQFSEPTGLTLDAEGNVWAADRGNNRVEEVAAGAYVRQFGGEGSGPGNLSAPIDTATDAEGNVWVADAGHNRVQEFNSKGEFLFQFGATGTGNGQFTQMHALAFDAEGHLWVAAAGRVQEFNAEGEYIRQFGSWGEGNGEFFALAGIAVDPAGHVWALDSGEGFVEPRLQEFSSEGAFLAEFGFAIGKEPGRLQNPQALAIDGSGNFWVADTGNNRIEEFSSKGAFLRASGSGGTENGQFKAPKGIEVDAGGDVWVADTGNNRIQELSTSGVYLAQFGRSGANNGQFSEPTGLTLDAEGNVWAADRGNNRVERWQLPGWNSSTYLDPIIAGSEGQLSAPNGVATDEEGNVWVADTSHDRIQEFSSQGEFVRQFGTHGSGDGQFSEPHGIAVDSSGNVWVADKGNYRIQEFNPEGEFIRKFGSAGTGNGQFGRLRGVAVDAEGHVWTIELGTEVTGKPRVQEFSSEGAYLAQFGSKGTGAGQFQEPLGIAADAKGDVWVADTGNKRIQEFSSKGQYLFAFGVPGGEEGQLASPVGLAIDKEGPVWVVDSGNNRISEFSSEGVYLRQFGAAGAGIGQLSGPKSLALDPSGSVWVADSANNRLEKWHKTTLPADPPAPDPNPSVAVTTSSGLVSSVEGKAAGKVTYSHSGQQLTAASGPKGNATYEYDASGRLKKVTLPKGTWGEVKYDSVGRVASVKTSIEGAIATTTYFEYSETLRRTVVTPEKGRATTYDIAADGSIFKWWNSTKAPTIEPLEGSLWYQRGEVHPGTVSPGDQSLNVLAKSVEGIASIQIVANGNQLVAEKTCEQNWEVAGIECQAVEKTFVTETENWPPGILQLEVIVTDREGLTSAQRFWDNIPYTPPPDPEALEPPRFEDIQRFRNEFGLDLDIAGNERAINDRIFQLIADWHDSSSPSGEIARASMGRWGVPLRAVDVAEMEYRERYAADAARLIPQWADVHAQSTFSGYYIDQRQGGIIHVGFAGASQPQGLSQLVSEVGEVPSGRTRTFEGQPRYSYKGLLEAWRADSAALRGQPIAKSMVSQAIDMANNKVEVKTEDVAGTESFLAQHSDRDKFEVIYATGRPMFRRLDTRPAFWTEGGGSPPKYNVREADRRIFAGDALIDAQGGSLGECTASWGATEAGPTKPNGEGTLVRYAITAGHCFSKGPTVYRFAREGKQFVEFPIGSVTARAYGIPIDGNETDAEAIRLQSGFSPPSWIFASQGSQLRSGAPAVPVVGEPVCHSGVEGGFRCGTVQRFTEQWIGDLPAWLWEASIFSCEGDSGGPYWQPEGNAPLGIEDGGPSHELPDGRVCGGPSYFTPLIESKAENMGVQVGKNVGVFKAPGLSNMTFYGG
jgi:YD repeat-containing protein